MAKNPPALLDVGTSNSERPSTPERSASFDVTAISREMRGEDGYKREGHAARTLVREADLRIVLMVMRAGSVIKEHRTNETASIHALAGHVRLRLSDRLLELEGGRLLVLERGVRHDVEAVDDSTILLTLGWPERGIT